MKRLALALLVAPAPLLVPLAAQAQGLSRQAVEALYAESDRLAVEDPPGLLRYMERHMYGSAWLTLDTTVTLPDGTGPFPQRLGLSKADLIAMERANQAQGARTVHSQTRVESFEPQPDGSAHARTRGVQRARLPAGMIEGMGAMSIEMQIETRDVWILSAGVPQITSSQARGTSIMERAE